MDLLQRFDFEDFEFSDEEEEFEDESDDYDSAYGSLDEEDLQQERIVDVIDLRQLDSDSEDEEEEPADVIGNKDEIIDLTNDSEDEDDDIPQRHYFMDQIELWGFLDIIYQHQLGNDSEDEDVPRILPAVNVIGARFDDGENNIQLPQDEIIDLTSDSEDEDVTGERIDNAEDADDAIQLPRDEIIDLTNDSEDDDEDDIRPQQNNIIDLTVEGESEDREAEQKTDDIINLTHLNDSDNEENISQPADFAAVAASRKRNRICIAESDEERDEIVAPVKRKR